MFKDEFVIITICSKGVKESGIGREGGTYGLEEYLEVKYVCMNLAGN